MHRTLIGVGLTLLLAVGCGRVTEDNWSETVSDSYCTFQKRCNAAEFFSNFDDVQTCSDANLDMLAELDSYYDACLFDKKQARQCLKALDSRCKEAGANFEELFQPCYEVWDCPLDFEASTDTALPF